MKIFFNITESYKFEWGDFDIWFTQAVVGIPESTTEEGYKMLVSDDAEWVDICDLFGRLVADTK